MSEQKKGFEVDQDLINRLKNNVIGRKQKIDFQRTEILLRTYREYEGESKIIQRARFFEALLREKKIYIDENLFVGSMAEEFGSFYLYPEWNTEWLKKERDKFEIPEEYEEHVKEIFSEWDRRTVPVISEEFYKDLYDEDFSDYVRSGFVRNGCTNPAGVSNSNTQKVIEKGLLSIISEVKEKRRKLEINYKNKDKFDFYKAVEIVLNAVIEYAERYSVLARQKADEETDPSKKAHYEAIAEITSKVPRYPAETFREALQSHFFLHLAQEIEQVGCGYSNGFLGQVLEPYYRNDLKKGLLTKEEATYLLKHFFLKLNDISYYYGRAYEIANSGDTAQTISLGGYTSSGQDATGEVDLLILDAQYDLRLPQPPLAVIYHDRISKELIKKSVELVKTGIGMPQFMSADVLVERSLNAYGRYGATIEEARRSCVFGCVSTAITNKTAYLMGDSVNIAKAIELVLHNGKDPVSGIQIGPETGRLEEFTDFESVVQAFKTQLQNGVIAARRHSKIDTMIYSKYLQLPLRSALTDGSIEAGADIWNGGARYAATATVFGGGIDAANSLLVIKKLVFDDRAISLEKLVEALDADFEGYESLEKLISNVPKYGNDVGEDDEVVRTVYDLAYEAFRDTGNNYLDLDARPDAYSKSFHNYFGLQTGALPNGRHAGKALTDGSVSATPGTDLSGPTALLHSAVKAIDAVEYNSVHLNVKLNPDLFSKANGESLLIGLIDGFVRNGGNHIQFNCIDANVLKDAKLNPQNHRDLVVRVAGFSAFFTQLHEGIQDEIIARTEHSLTA